MPLLLTQRYPMQPRNMISEQMLSMRSIGLFLVLLIPFMACQSQDVHPKKKHFQDAMSWPATQPGDVTLQNFKPFRAVYQRNYTNGSGQPRTDRVIVMAEEIAWFGDAAVAITLTDTGDPAFDDTNARSMTMYVKQEDLTLLLEIAPQPGTAVDYYIARRLDDKVTVNRITTETGEHQFQAPPTDAPGFGPGSWVIANSALETGKKIRLDPVYSPRSNALTGFTAIGYVAGQETYTDLSGNTYQAWMVQHSSNLTNPYIVRRSMINEPPYLLGTESIDLDTGDKRRYSMHLMSFEYLDGK